MINVAVYDNKIESAVLIRSCIESCFRRYTHDYAAEIYTSCDELMLDHHKFSALFISTDFLDPEIMHMTKFIKSSLSDSRLIFISNNPQTAYKAFSCQPFAFVKRCSIEPDLSEAVSSLFHELTRREMSVNFKSGDSTIDININDIDYFETFGHTIEINLGYKSVPIRGSLKALESQFRQYGFLRIHKSYLVNCRHIYKISRQTVTLSNMKTLPVGRGKADELRAELHKYLCFSIH